MLRLRLATPFLICALPLALVACGEKAVSDPRTSLPVVRVAVVQEANLASRAFTGTVAARVQSDLGFRVPGKVLERLVDAGQSVKRGQVLMRIDSVDLKLAAQAQDEAVLAARARARQAADDEARYRDLRGTGAISASAYDQVKAAADAAQAQLSAAEAQARVALNASHYAELVADGDGVVVETLAEPGQIVAAGQVVVRLARAGQREALIQLPETLRPTIGSAAKASLFGKEGVEVSARLRQLSNSADRSTRTFEARYVLEGDLAQAPLGSTVVIRVNDRGTATGGSFNVPLASLYDAGQGPGVWVIRGEPARVSWQRVAVERLDDSSAQVTGKIKPGDRIVALGAHLLREDQEVKLLDVVATAAGQGARP
ncbi:efflux RND transporter periplasmic adaptor subunit [Curvibacter lanceolatus]|uniref:efflux RND transporter periplasmic adaptor subunit n=1 Tax=Curvibacter lanceolatus TaxID=86182 RepID=UPI0003A8E33F|nr:efflux RND transporter periplasmic adaptor subunit [Curvibacter lanceolatus]